LDWESCTTQQPAWLERRPVPFAPGDMLTHAGKHWKPTVADEELPDMQSIERTLDSLKCGAQGQPVRAGF